MDATAFVTDAATEISSRFEDRDGRLFVGPSVLTRAGVDDYLGREVDGWQGLGLEPDRIYRFFRSPQALKAALPRMAMQPLTSEHVALSASDHDEGKTIGAIGSGVTYDDTDNVVRAPLSIWRDPYIKRVKSGDQKELSMGYRFRLDMTPGVWNGQPYDGAMTDITPNHVALVPAGRVNLNSDGPLAAVADSASKGESQVADEDDKNKDGKPTGGAGDEGGEDVFGPLVECLRAFVPDANDDQLRAAIAQLVAGLSAQTGENQTGATGDEGGDPKPGEGAAGDEGNGNNEGCAMDTAALIEKARADAIRDAMAQMRELREAEEAVRPVVGRLGMAMDSAGAVYRYALSRMGVAEADVKGMGDAEAARTYRAMSRVKKDAKGMVGDSAPSLSAVQSARERLGVGRLSSIDGIV